MRKSVAPSKPLVLAVLLLACTGLLGSCRGAFQVTFEDSKCLIGGAAATLAQVEKQQAKVAHRISERQPFMVALTVVVIALASTGYVERLLLLLSARRAGATSLAERFRRTMERYREKPLRYFGIIVAAFGLLIVAAGLYVFLDSDRRNDETELARLQFCQLALRSAQASDFLDVQRRSLAALSDTASGIAALVSKLPPEEQKKAQQIVDELSAALAKEDKVIEASIERNQVSVQDLAARTQALEHGLESVQGDLAKVTAMPAAVAAVATQLKGLSEQVAAANALSAASAGHWSRMEERLVTLGEQVNSVAKRGPGTAAAGGAPALSAGKAVELGAVARPQAAAPANAK